MQGKQCCTGAHICMVLAFFFNHSAIRSLAQVELPSNAPECVRWAAEDVRSALAQKHIPVAGAQVEVAIGDAGGLDEQGFSLKRDGMRIEIEAGGPTGAMYGLQELAEQVSDSGPVRSATDFAAAISPTTQRPFVEIRADNPFIHVYPIELGDLDMWHEYIDMLARNRFNLLDMHGAYDLDTTSFPNLYPQLVEVPGYPTAGGFTAEYRAKTLASFKAIIAYAKSRGVRVAFMNYSAVNDAGGVRKGETFLTNIPPEKLADYTAKAVSILIRELPDLYMLGFRVGESGQSAAFYKDAYIRGVDEADRPDLRLYTRSWQTTKEQLEPIAEAAHNGFDIEIKFNGEQLGLPYQAMQGAAYGSYSYQGYLDVPANYEIIWQIRANGTHRFWAWENTDFIRRTVRSCRLGNARGFTLEPHTAYFSVYSGDYYRSPQDALVYPYIWQKHWMWYYAWGRLGYNPDLPESTLAEQFHRHYGDAGDAAYCAMQQAGEIVPLAYAYRFVGPDQRDFSPETETGNSDTKVKRARQDILQFAENKPEDERSFAGIDTFVNNKLSNSADGRYGPLAVAAMLGRAANVTRSTLTSAAQPSGRAADEFRLLEDDLLTTSYFGDYYVHRIQGMTWFDFSLHSGSRSDLEKALAELAASRESWHRLSKTADAVYKPLANPLRRQSGFQWSSQLEPLAKLDATAHGFWQQHKAAISDIHLSPNSTDSGTNPGLSAGPLTQNIVNAKATITCTPTAQNGVASVTLWWKPLPSELGWESLPMSGGPGGVFTASFPIDRRGALYLVDVHDRQGNAHNFPDERKETPYRVIPVLPSTHSSSTSLQ